MMNREYDRPVMATADDAITAKQAAVNTGYYDDPFLSAFSASQSQSRPRRQVQPIIKRGTHARVCVMDRAISTFLNNSSATARKSTSTTSTCQVIVLGAGKDTSYFRYCSQSIMGQELPPNKENLFVKWYEVDHTAVIQEKAKTIQSSSSSASSNMLTSSLFPPLQPIQHSHGAAGYQTANDHSSYFLIQHDLRDTNTLLDKLPDLDPSLPTLVLIECVFMYLPSPDSKALLQHLTSRLQHATMVAYEPILLLGQDPFGRMMERNLKQAGVASHDCCLLVDRSLEQQLQKFVGAGFDAAVACDMWSAYETIMTAEQRRRANQSEFLDEVEEWMLIMRHYCFLAARIGGEGVTSKEEEEGMDMTSVGAGSPLGFMTGKCERRGKN